MVKISGLDQLSKQLEEAQKALGALDGNIGQVSFDPHDPASIDHAIREVEAMVDERAGQYTSNPFVGPLVEELKEKYREAIVEKAAAVRLEGSAGE
jgi:hypothetical protein